MTRFPLIVAALLASAGMAQTQTQTFGCPWTTSNLPYGCPSTIGGEMTWAEPKTPAPRNNLDAALQACMAQGSFGGGSDGTSYGGPESLRDGCLKIHEMWWDKEKAEQDAEEAEQRKNAEKRAAAALPIIERGLRDPDGKPPK